MFEVECKMFRKCNQPLSKLFISPAFNFRFFILILKLAFLNNSSNVSFIPKLLMFIIKKHAQRKSWNSIFKIIFFIYLLLRLSIWKKIIHLKHIIQYIYIKILKTYVIQFFFFFHLNLKTQTRSLQIEQTKFIGLKTKV